MSPVARPLRPFVRIFQYLPTGAVDTASREYGNVDSGDIKGGEFLETLSDYQTLGITVLHESVSSDKLNKLHTGLC